MAESAPRGHAPIRSLLLKLMSPPLFSRMFGRLADIRRPRRLVRFIIGKFVRMYHIDLEPVEHPIDHYASLSAFFIRRLKPDARPIDSREDAIVSPVDARILTAGRISENGEALQIKGRRYRVSDLIPDPVNPIDFANGSYVQLYLSPRDYHRIHHPVDGQIVRARHVRGRLFPVNEFSLNRFDGVLAKNDRILVQLESRGRTLYAALVGALNVGRIGLTAADYETNRGQRLTDIPIHQPEAAKGTEMGWFCMGSTVVLIDPAGAIQWTVEPGDRVQVGNTIGAWR